MEHITFGSADIETALAGLAQEEFDRLPFGAIQVDERGTILRYNATEGALVGYDPEAMIGLNFFRDVAPCTDSPAFYGRFQEGVARRDLNVLFEYTFEKEDVAPLRVKVQMKRALGGDTYWIFVKRVLPFGQPRAMEPAGA